MSSRSSSTSPFASSQTANQSKPINRSLTHTQFITFTFTLCTLPTSHIAHIDGLTFSGEGKKTGNESAIGNSPNFLQHLPKSAALFSMKITFSDSILIIYSSEIASNPLSRHFQGEKNENFNMNILKSSSTIISNKKYFLNCGVFVRQNRSRHFLQRQPTRNTIS